MKKKAEVKYQGITANTSDYECADGELSVSANLIHEDGQVKPLQQPKSLSNLGIAYDIIYIHVTPQFRHYIVSRLNIGLYWLDADNMPSSVSPQDLVNKLITTDTEALKVSHVGNTLTVLNSNGVFYYKWNQDNSSYKNLGQKPPMLHIQFGLSDNYQESFSFDNLPIRTGSFPSSTYTAWNYTDIPLTDVFQEYLNGHDTINKMNVLSAQRTNFTNAVWALINKTNAVISKSGHFYSPFFVRYAYRLYDGSLWMHSAPVYMPVSSIHNFNVFLANAGCYSSDYDNIDGLFFLNYEAGIAYSDPTFIYPAPYGDDNFTFEPGNRLTLFYQPRSVSLQYSCINGTVLSTLDADWGDIIKSVDIFVTPPIYREDPSREIPSVSVSNNNGYRLIKAHMDVVDVLNTTRDPDRSMPWYIWLNSQLTALCNVRCDIPFIPDSEYLDKLQHTSSFFKVASFNLSDFIWTNYHNINIRRDVLPNLTTQEPMSDDYNSHCNFLPVVKDGKCLSQAFSYNGRLNIANISEQLYEGFPLAALVPSQCYFESDLDILDCQHVYVYLNTEQGLRIVDCSSLNNGYRPYPDQNPGKHAAYLYPLFYPDNRAFQMDLVVKRIEYDEIHSEYVTVQRIYRFPMHQHPFLNGSITDGHIMTDASTPFDVVDYVAPSLSDILSYPNSLYTSEVYNPFVFRPENIQQVGAGYILGIAAAVKPLSQGQFGQFPLYVFTSDGIWALSSADDGSYSAVKPVSRDVCTDADSIVSIDNAVLFATDRGIMLLQALDTECITDALRTACPFSLLSLPRLSLVTNLAEKFDWQGSFGSFLSACRIIYDYTHQRIILFNSATFNPVPQTYNSESVENSPAEQEVVGDTENQTVRLYNYAFVFSLKSRRWGMMQSSINHTINSYPEALAVTSNKHLVSFSASNQAAYDVQLVVSRPLKLGMSDTNKTIYTLIQRGNFARGHIKTVLYGSRDLQHWHIVGSSRLHELRNLAGSGFKYFRIVVIGNLSRGESLSGATLEIQTN